MTETDLTSQKTTIAVLGLGAMGARMARRLIDAGHDVAVYNRSPERAAALVEAGARLAPTPRAAAEGRAFVIACVRDDDAARAVWTDPEIGALPAMGAGAIAIESSTLTPACARGLAAAAYEQGVALLDAPVAGSRPQAEAGKLIYMVGGEAAALEQARPVLETLGGAVHYCGESGSGAVLKLLVNALFGVQIAAVAELLALADKSGVPAAKALEILGAMPVTSPAAKGVGGLMIAGKLAPMFPIDLVAKDFRYVENAAAAANTAVPTASAVRAVYERAIDDGHGDLNIAGVCKLFFAGE